ncbi:hypothetical protein V2J09_006191 [Rumex salicifolius]
MTIWMSRMRSVLMMRLPFEIIFCMTERSWMIWSLRLHSTPLAPHVSSPTLSHLPTPGHATFTEPGCGRSFSPTHVPDHIPDSAALELPLHSAAPDSAAHESKAARGPSPDLPRSFPSGPRSLDLLCGYESHITKAIFELTPVIAPVLVIAPLLPPLPPSRRRGGRRGQLAGVVVVEVAPATEEAPVAKQSLAAIEPPTTEQVVAGEVIPREALPVAVVSRRGPGVGDGDLCLKVLHIHFRTSFTTPLERYIRDDQDSWFRIIERSGLTHLRLMGMGP